MSTQTLSNNEPTGNVDRPKGPMKELVSYLTLRKIIGLLGVMLPIVLAFGCHIFGECEGLLESISEYHGTVMRDVFSGVLFTVGWFLFTYRGYDSRDDIAGNMGCLFALGVALFPTYSKMSVISNLHYISAAAFFTVLSIFSLFLFTKSSGTPTPEKQKRNKVYIICGVTMVSCMVLITIYNLFLEGSWVTRFKPVLVLESLALWAFGTSWLTKGEMIWKDLQKQKQD